MSNVKHTPGPWRIDPGPGFSRNRIEDADGICVAFAWGLGLEADANARLIAAAPDLLVALKEAADPIAGHLHGPTLDRALAAIDKAEGRDR